MSSPITPIAGPVIPQVTPSKSTSNGADAFADLLRGAINRVEGLRQNADQSIDQMLSGQGGELHNTVMATQRAELAFDLFMQVRNKVTSAYQEIMKMQV